MAFIKIGVGKYKHLKTLGIFTKKGADFMGDIYGYARVSTKEQNLNRQRQALHDFGIPEKYIFEDRASGKDFNRRAYNALVGTEDTVPLLHEGDLLVIYSIDRLGRNYTEIQGQWKHITKNLRADIKVLDMPLLDTQSSNGSDLEKTFIADLVLQILSYCSQKERENILSRQKQGIAAMKIVDGKKVSIKTGNPTGRPPIDFPDGWEACYQKWKDKEITAVQAMKCLSLKTNTFYKLVHRYEKEKSQPFPLSSPNHHKSVKTV